MRGPLDDILTSPEMPDGKEREARVPSRPPGGKALMRLLYLLDSAGRPSAAAETIELAVPQEERERFLETAAAYRLRPEPATDEGEADERGPRGRPAGGRARREAAPPDDATRADALRADLADLAETYATAAEALGTRSAAAPQWRSLGPWTIPNGQTYGQNRVNVSGRVSALAVDPSNPAHVLAGAANGGVWESRDRGASWAPRTDFAPTLAVGALAFDPTNPRIVYCGTGEGDWWWFLGAGLMRSTDGGTNWTVRCTAPFVGQGFHDIVVDRADGQRLLAGTTHGLYTSADGGATWTRQRNSRTWSLAMAPAGGAGAEILAACGDGLWRSTNGGAAWAREALPGAPASFDRLAVDIAPSNPAVAYAWGASGGTARLWRRAGGTWTSIGAPPGVNVGQAWYDWFLAVAPDRDTQIYCGAIEAHRGDLSGGNWTWLNLTAKGAGQSSIHPDQHAIAFEPGRPDTVYIGNDGGVYRSEDRGVVWQHCNNGLVVTEFEYIAQNLGSSRWLIGGTQDNGTQRWRGSPVWEHVADGDGGDCGVNRGTPTTVFHTYFNISPERSTTGGDFGSWTGIRPSIPAGEREPFYPPFECSATGGDTIAIGGGALYVSRNNGASWTRLAFPAAGVATALGIPNADNVYVGLEDGRIYRTRWSSGAWGALSALTTPRASATVSDLLVEPSNLNRIWATHRTIGGGRVFLSTDGGTNWADRTAGLPNLPINAIESDPANSNRVWVGADLGVYQTTDGGATWATFSNGLPHMYVGDLAFHVHARVLRAGTRSRGVWEIPVDGWPTAPSCGVQFTGSLAANETRRWFTFRWPATWHVIWTVMPTTPAPGAPQVGWSVAVERAENEYVTYWITVRNLTARPVSFEGRYAILSRY